MSGSGIRLEELDLTSDNCDTEHYERRIAEIQARLTELPEARAAKVVLSNTDPSLKSIQLFDKDGHFIGRTRFENSGRHANRHSGRRAGARARSFGAGDSDADTRRRAHDSDGDGIADPAGYRVLRGADPAA